MLKIDGDIQRNRYYKVSNPIRQKAVPNPSFKGHVLTTNAEGRKVYKFNLPNAPQGTVVQLMPLSRDKNGTYIPLKEAPVNFPIPNNSTSLTISSDDISLAEGVVLGYRFKTGENQYFFDNVEQNSYDETYLENNYNIATPIDRVDHTLPRQMIHVMTDMIKAPDDEQKDARKIHFNTIGGTINDVREKLPLIKEFGANRILGTPIMGQNIAHGYWTNNAYQITDTLGNLTDFKKLQIDLYKNAMGWIADGAFVNEGLQGIHLEDMGIWGTDSPALHMYETKNIGDEIFKFGVLSKQPDVDKHTRFKIANGPYKVLFKKNGNGGFEEAGFVKNHDFNPKQPTFVQIFDERLVSEQQVNQNKPFINYAKKNADDTNEINEYKDSVQPYYFKVTPSDVEINYKRYKSAKLTSSDVRVRDALTSWTNREIVPSNKDGGISLWVGNSDIAKKRFMVPESLFIEDSFANKPEVKELIKAGQYQVQDDTVQVGKYWTSETSRTLLEYTAKEITNKLAEGKSYEEAVNELVAENKIPAEAELINDKTEGVSPLQNLLDFDENGERKYKLDTGFLPQNITDGLMSYPFESIEFAPDLLSVFSYPALRNLAVTKDYVGKSRYEMYKDGNKYYSLLPAKYRDIYKKTDDIIANNMTNKARDIIRALDSADKFDGLLLDDNGKLTEDGRAVYSLIAPDIAKFLIVSALAPSVKFKNDSEFFEYNIDDLRNVSLESLNLQYENTPEATAEKLIDKLNNGLNNISESTRDKFIEHTYNRIKNIDADTISISKLILEKTESGLDWRIDAAKDVGDWDAVDAERYDANECFDNVIDFWTKFNKGVRQYNPKSYTIGEMTQDIPVPENWNWFDKESDFIHKTGFTTQSNYSYLYSTPVKFYGRIIEPGGEFNQHYDNIDENVFTQFMWKNEDKGQKHLNYLFSGPKNNIDFSHLFVGNHDKPRILHSLAVNPDKFAENKADAVKNLIINEGFYKSSVFNNLPQTYKELLVDSIKRLSEGTYTYNGREKYYDDENFGARPFDVNIDDVIKEASNKNDNFKKYAADPANNIKLMKAQILCNVLTPAMERYRSLMFFLAGMPGTPTNYIGDELGETGWETTCKNERQQNRNRLHWEWLTDPNYSFIKEYRKRIADVMNIRNQKGASPLVNGSTILLTPQKIEGGSAVTVYRYNDKSDVISVFHNQGYDNIPVKNQEDRYIPFIDLSARAYVCGLPSALTSGTQYYNVLNPSERFSVGDDNKIYKNGGGDIALGNSGIILARVKDFEGNDNLDGSGQPLMRCRTAAQHVMLNNLKYDDLLNKRV